MAFFLPLTLQPCGRVAMPAKHVTSHHSCRWIFIAGFHVFFPVFSVSFFFSGCISHQVPVRAYWHSRVPKDLPEHAWAPPPPFYVRIFPAGSHMCVILIVLKNTQIWTHDSAQTAHGCISLPSLFIWEGWGFILAMRRFVSRQVLFSKAMGGQHMSRNASSEKMS